MCERVCVRERVCVPAQTMKHRCIGFRQVVVEQVQLEGMWSRLPGDDITDPLHYKITALLCVQQQGRLDFGCVLRH